MYRHGNICIGMTPNLYEISDMSYVSELYQVYMQHFKNEMVQHNSTDL